MAAVDWRTQRVVLTGGAGLVGRVVRSKLEARGCREIVVPRSVTCDLREPNQIRRLLAEARPTMVIHLAAVVGGIGANRANPGRFFYENMVMGLHLIEEARRAGVPKFVQVGTICAYPKFTPVPFREEELWNGYPEETNAPYGIAKKALLVQLQSYRQQYGFRGIYLLPVNLYGPHDNFDLETSHVIPALIRKFLEAGEAGAASVSAWGSGTPSREFLYVDDAAEGIVLAAERYDAPEPVNLGAGAEITIRALTELVRELTGYSGRIEWDASRPDGQPRRSLDVSRAAAGFGFQAVVPLREGLSRTIRWYRDRMTAAPEPAPAFTPAVQIGVGGLELTARERGYVDQVLASGRLSYGPFSRRFEEEFARAHDCRFAVFCNSGTSALHIALQALKVTHGWKDGDEVIVPAVTFVATANIVLHNGMTPVFVDVDPVTCNINPTLIAAAVTPRTRAIIPVHLFGQPADMDEVLAAAAAHGLRIIEDSAETMFARYRGRSVGGMGDLGCFSTYVAHLLVTGVGGFATTNDPGLAVTLRSLMNHGRDSIYLTIDDDRGATGERLQEIVARRFSFVHHGHSFRCTELEAALGLGQIEQREDLMARRRTNADRLLAGLAGLEDDLVLPRRQADRDHVFMMVPLQVRRGTKRALVNYLEERLIETRDLMPLLSQPAFRGVPGADLARFPVAARIDEAGFYLGCHPYLRAAEVDYMAATVRAFFRR